MDKLIEWLLQRTADGATYLQVIIVGLLLFIMISIVFKSIEDVMEHMKVEAERTEDNRV